MRVAVIGEPAGWHVGRLVQRLVSLGHDPAVIRWADVGAEVIGCEERFLPPALDAAERVLVRGMPGAAAGGDRLEQVVVRMDILARLAARRRA